MVVTLCSPEEGRCNLLQESKKDVKPITVWDLGISRKTQPNCDRSCKLHLLTGLPNGATVYRLSKFHKFERLALPLDPRDGGHSDCPKAHKTYDLCSLHHSVNLNLFGNTAAPVDGSSKNLLQRKEWYRFIWFVPLAH